MKRTFHFGNSHLDIEHWENVLNVSHAAYMYIEVIVRGIQFAGYDDFMKYLDEKVARHEIVYIAGIMPIIDALCEYSPCTLSINYYAIKNHVPLNLVRKVVMTIIKTYQLENGVKSDDS